jgi:hypothetical protein
MHEYAQPPSATVETDPFGRARRRAGAARPALERKRRGDEAHRSGPRAPRRPGPRSTSRRLGQIPVPLQPRTTGAPVTRRTACKRLVSPRPDVTGGEDEARSARSAPLRSMACSDASSAALSAVPAHGETGSRGDHAWTLTPLLCYTFSAARLALHDHPGRRVSNRTRCPFRVVTTAAVQHSCRCGRATRQRGPPDVPEASPARQITSPSTACPLAACDQANGFGLLRGSRPAAARSPCLCPGSTRRRWPQRLYVPVGTRRAPARHAAARAFHNQERGPLLTSATPASAGRATEIEFAFPRQARTRRATGARRTSPRLHGAGADPIVGRNRASISSRRGRQPRETVRGSRPHSRITRRSPRSRFAV